LPRWPQVLPGGKAVLFTVSANPFSWEDANVGVVSVKTGEIKIVQHGGYFGRYVPSPYGTGHLLYVHEGALFAVPFDPDRLETTSSPVPFPADVAGNSVDGGGQFDGSANGSLVYVSGKSAATSSYPIVWMESSGKTTPLLAKPSAYGALRFSPDGKRLAFTAMVSKGPDVWVYDWERDTPTQLTFTAPGNLEMAWTPDGKHIVFGSSAAGTAALWWIRADGSGEPLKLLERKNTGVGLRPQSFTPDGRRLAFDDNVTSGTGVEIWTLPLDLSDPEHPKPGKPEPFLTLQSGKWTRPFLRMVSGWHIRPTNPESTTSLSGLFLVPAPNLKSPQAAASFRYGHARATNFSIFHWATAESWLRITQSRETHLT
jgi:WD40 repeat protein